MGSMGVGSVGRKVRSTSGAVGTAGGAIMITPGPWHPRASNPRPTQWMSLRPGPMISLVMRNSTDGNIEPTA
jgi:hypothetical protein